MTILHAAILPTILCCCLAYLLCGIPFGLLIARLRGVDVRKVGSGNIGTTNVARSVGVVASGLTLLLDAGKGFVSMELARHLIPWMAEREFKVFDLSQTAGVAITIVYVACVCGHIFSPYLGFKGGKGIAVGFGAALGLDWHIALGVLVVFILVVVPSRYLSRLMLRSSVAAVLRAHLRGRTRLADPLCVRLRPRHLGASLQYQEAPQ